MHLANAATIPRSERVQRNATCDASANVGNVVYVSGPAVGGSLQVSLFDPDVNLTFHALGIITHKYTSTTCSVQLHGIVTSGVTGLLPGLRYYAGPSGTLVLAGAVSMEIMQYVGVALDTDQLMLDPDLPLATASGGTFDNTFDFTFG